MGQGGQPGVEDGACTGNVPADVLYEEGEFDGEDEDDDHEDDDPDFDDDEHDYEENGMSDDDDVCS